MPASSKKSLISFVSRRQSALVIAIMPTPETHSRYIRPPLHHLTNCLTVVLTEKLSLSNILLSFLYLLTFSFFRNNIYYRFPGPTEIHLNKQPAKPKQKKTIKTKLLAVKQQGKVKKKKLLTFLFLLFSLLLRLFSIFFFTCTQPKKNSPFSR
jgi:hypothetical protein